VNSGSATKLPVALAAAAHAAKPVQAAGPPSRQKNDASSGK
jgi:hypothetical protein